MTFYILLTAALTLAGLAYTAVTARAVDPERNYARVPARRRRVRNH